jgi:integrase
MVDGKQKIEATGTSNKRVAQKILEIRLAEIIEGRFGLPKSNAPRLEQFSNGFLTSIRHQNTKKRYSSSVASIRTQLGDARLSDINSARIEEFKHARLLAGVRAATVNRDLAVLRRMLNIAVRKRLITFTPFREVETLEERKERRQPHIVTFDEEYKILAVAADHIRVLAILILETGLRSGREALALKWKDIDFVHNSIRVRESKTFAGLRSVPMSNRCRAELLRWRALFGPEYSEYVFANPQRSEIHLRDVRANWANALKAAGLKHFWLYDLRHTFATRATESGAPSLFVAAVMGHSNPNIMQTYAKATDDYRRSVISKLEALREAHTVQSTAPGLHLIQ